MQEEERLQQEQHGNVGKGGCVDPRDEHIDLLNRKLEFALQREKELIDMVKNLVNGHLFTERRLGHIIELLVQKQ